MKIAGKQQYLDRYIKLADPFTDKSIGTAGITHQRSILIDADADEGTVTFTAENNYSAIEFTVTEGIDIIEGGRILIKATDIRTVLSTLQPEETVTLESTDDKTVNITGAQTDITIGVVPIASGKVRVPSVGETPNFTTLTVKSEEFAQGFLTGGAARDETRRFPVYMGVHAQTTEDGKRLRFMSSNQKVSAYATIPAESEGPIELLLDPATTSGVLDYLRQGEQTKVVASEDGRIAHYVVVGKEGETIFHIRVATMAHDPKDFPAVKLLGRLEQLVNGKASLVMPKAEILRLFYNADRMCTLSPNDTGGQAKNINVDLSTDSFGVSIDGPASYDTNTDVKTWTGPDTSFTLQWGLHGHLIEAYPGKDDINVAALENKGRPIALALYTGEGWSPEDGGLPEDYLALLPIKGGQYN